MSAPVITIDTSGLRTLAVGTRRTIAAGTARAVRIALNEAADYARRNHVHTKRTGQLTSKQNLYAEMRQADERGAWGYLINRTPYARSVEYGAKAHEIWPKAAAGMIGPLRSSQTRRVDRPGFHEQVVGRGLALRFRVGGKIVFARMVRHPGNRPLKFMEPAQQYGAEVIRRETEQTTFRLVRELWE
jgi:hypothetical protein